VGGTWFLKTKTGIPGAPTILGFTARLAGCYFIVHLSPVVGSNGRRGQASFARQSSQRMIISSLPSGREILKLSALPKKLGAAPQPAHTFMILSFLPRIGGT